MQITFELPPVGAALLQHLLDHIRQHAGEIQTPDAVCRSLVLDVLFDDALAHLPHSVSDRQQ